MLSNVALGAGDLLPAGQVTHRNSYKSQHADVKIAASSHEDDGDVHDIRLSEPSADQAADRFEQRIRIVTIQVTCQVESTASRLGPGRFIGDRSCGVGRAVFAVRAATQDRNATHPGFAELGQDGQNELLIPSSLARVRAERHRCFSSKAYAGGG